VLATVARAAAEAVAAAKAPEEAPDDPWLREPVQTWRRCAALPSAQCTGRGARRQSRVAGWVAASHLRKCRTLPRRRRWIRPRRQYQRRVRWRQLAWKAQWRHRQRFPQPMRGQQSGRNSPLRETPLLPPPRCVAQCRCSVPCSRRRGGRGARRRGRRCGAVRGRAG